VMLLDHLRPPVALDPAATAYKDWLHLNLFDHLSGMVGMVNVSLHGAPEDPRSRAVGTALVHDPDFGWIGNLDVEPMADARIGTDSVALRHVALAVTSRRGTVSASARFPDEALDLRLVASPDSTPISMDRRMPVGQGWISWYVVPRLRLDGEIEMAGRRVAMRSAWAYHDHNWGRWHWGDDLGWEWGTFVTAAAGATFVVIRSTNRSHGTVDEPLLVFQTEGQRRIFTGRSVRISLDGLLEADLRRLPGAMAALHQDRVGHRLPARVEVEADDGVDRVSIHFVSRAAAQVVAADPIVRGYAFIHEIVGEFSVSGTVRGERLMGKGLGVFEYVD
jgi:hypothetical protein